MEKKVDLGIRTIVLGTPLAVWEAQDYMSPGESISPKELLFFTFKKNNKAGKGSFNTIKIKSKIEELKSYIKGLFKGKVNVPFSYDKKIAKQMKKRGWDDDSIQDTLRNPSRTVKTKDTRYRPDGTRNNDPATAYIREDGSYVVRNDRTENIVQVSDRNDPNWVFPWD